MSDFLDGAEHGASSLQYFLAAEINADDNHPNRMIESLKWLIISRYLGDSLPEHVIPFMVRGMTKDDVKRSFDLADKWVIEKIDIASNPNVDPHSLDWSQKLQELTGLKKRLLEENA